MASGWEGVVGERIPVGVRTAEVGRLSPPEKAIHGKSCCGKHTLGKRLKSPMRYRWGCSSNKIRLYDGF